MAETETIRKKTSRKISVGVNPDDIKIVGLLAKDLNIRQIAGHIGMNQRTLERKIVIMKSTYGAKTLTGLEAFFFRNNLIK